MNILSLIRYGTVQVYNIVNSEISLENQWHLVVIFLIKSYYPISKI